MQERKREGEFALIGGQGNDLRFKRCSRDARQDTSKMHVFLFYFSPFTISTVFFHRLRTRSVISRNSLERETAESYPYANAGYYPYGTGAKLKVPRANVCRTRNERFKFEAPWGKKSSRPDPFCSV